MDYSTARETVEFQTSPPSNTHVPSVLLPEMKHTVVLSLLNNIKVYVVTHVKVKYRPIVALSDDIVSV
jgi:hypothetical protein